MCVMGFFLLKVGPPWKNFLDPRLLCYVYLCKLRGGSGLFIATITKQVLERTKIDIDAMLISYLWNIHVQCMFHFKKLLFYTKGRKSMHV